MFIDMLPVDAAFLLPYAVFPQLQRAACCFGNIQAGICPQFDISVTQLEQRMR
jgi:hypothetical protein